MRKSIVLTLILGFLSLVGKAGQVIKTELGIRATVDSVNIEIQFFGTKIVRVIKTPEGEDPDLKSFSVIKKAGPVALKIASTDNWVTVNSPELKVTLDLVNGKVSFFDSEEKLLLAEKNHGSRFTSMNYPSGKSYRVFQSFMLEPSERIYGLGQIQNGKLVQRNQKIRLKQENMKIAIPFFQSEKGYGLFWDNSSQTDFSDNQEETSFDSESGLATDYYFMAGGNADGVIALMRDLTGEVPMIPYWSFGFWQSRERYTSQEELVNVVKKYRDLNVPLDGIVQDWQYWSTDNHFWNGLEFGNPLFPDPKKMMDQVHQMNAHLIISVWPSFGPETKPFEELNDKNMLYSFKTFPDGSGVKLYDAYNPKARDIVWKHMADGIYQYGTDGWWLDATEPELPDFTKDDGDFKTYAGPYRNVYNSFPLQSVGGVFNHQREADSGHRVFILTRSAYAGQQRYAATSWSGDVTSSWEVLRDQIPAGLSFSLSGIPFWNSDIGGFFSGRKYPEGIKSDAYRELYVRWLQFGTFCTMMRSHGSNTPREIYQFGNRGNWAFDAIEKYIKLRYRLLPYIYSNAWAVTSESSTMMRALVMDFQNDEKACPVDNQFMFGREIMVCPVTEAQYTSDLSGAKADFSVSGKRSVYLPGGTDWYDFWTGEKLEGGRTIVTETPVEIIPLYVHAGSILPLGPDIQYATQRFDPVEIRIYPGNNGEFVLYDDEKDGYGYEKGVYSTVNLKWNDKQKQLTIGARTGSYPGMPVKRFFNVIIVGPNQGIGDKVYRQVKSIVEYDGKEQVVNLN